jgi:hypothetical protein
MPAVLYCEHCAREDTRGQAAPSRVRWNVPLDKTERHEDGTLTYESMFIQCPLCERRWLILTVTDDPDILASFCSQFGIVSR